MVLGKGGRRGRGEKEGRKKEDRKGDEFFLHLYLSLFLRPLRLFSFFRFSFFHFLTTWSACSAILELRVELIRLWKALLLPRVLPFVFCRVFSTVRLLCWPSPLHHMSPPPRLSIAVFLHHCLRRRHYLRFPPPLPPPACDASTTTPDIATIQRHIHTASIASSTSGGRWR